jgi:hypothetical protein
MAEQVYDSAGTFASTVPPNKSPKCSSVSLTEFFEMSCSSRGAFESDDKGSLDRANSAGGFSSKSSSCGNENWANFELVTISASSTISFDNRFPTGDSSTTSFVVFESAWHAWLLGETYTLNSNLSTLPSVSVDDEDGWMDQLLPLRHQQTHDRRKIPLLQRNPRDQTVHHRFLAGTSHYHHYQAAYVANSSVDVNGITPSTGEHLSNEEWIAQRRRRDGRLRRRYMQEVEQMLGLEQVVISSPEESSSTTNLDQLRFVRRNMSDGQTLLSIDSDRDNDYHISTAPERYTRQLNQTPMNSNTSTNQERLADDGVEHATSTIVSTHEQPRQQPQLRFRARRPTVASHARIEQFQHWSSSAVQRSLDVVLIPWRMVFRNEDDQGTIDGAVVPTNRPHSTASAAEDIDRSFSDDMSGRAISSEANSISHEDERGNDLPPWPSGRGWRWGPTDDSVNDMDDDHDDDGNSDTSSGRTRYWSTGTAMETDYDSSSYSSSLCQGDRREMEEWVDGLIQFPPVEEEDPHQYEFMPTPEDPLFPDDPFSESF